MTEDVDSLVERVLAGIISDSGDDTTQEAADAALTELAERVEAAEKTLCEVAEQGYERVLQKAYEEALARAEAAERQVQIEGAAADANGRDARAAEAQRDELVEALERIEQWPTKIFKANETAYVPNYIHDLARAALAKVRSETSAPARDSTPRTRGEGGPEVTTDSPGAEDDFLPIGHPTC